MSQLWKGRASLVLAEVNHTGASLSLITHETYQQLWSSRPLKTSSVNLCVLDSPVKAQEIRTWTRRHTAVMGKGVYSEWLASCSGTPVETLLVMSFGVDSGRWMHCVGVLCCRPHSSETACVATAP